MVAVAPRSTCSHWGSENALDHRVPGLPSRAALAGVPAFSVEEAEAVFPWESRVSAAAGDTATASAATTARATVAARAARLVERRTAILLAPVGVFDASWTVFGLVFSL